MSFSFNTLLTLQSTSVSDPHNFEADPNPDPSKNRHADLIKVFSLYPPRRKGEKPFSQVFFSLQMILSNIKKNRFFLKVFVTVAWNHLKR